MGKSKDQRRAERIDFSDSPPVAVGFIKQLIRINRKYIEVPEKAEMTENIGNWMSFEKDIYYPVGGLDSGLHPCKMFDKMLMAVEWMSPTKDLQQAEFCCTPKSNLYWFRAISFNAPGTVTITFSIPNQKGKNRIEPMRIVVGVSRTAGSLPPPINDAVGVQSTKEKKRAAQNGTGDGTGKGKIEVYFGPAPEKQAAISTVPVSSIHDSACALLSRPWIESVTISSRDNDSPLLHVSSALRGALLDDKWRQMSPSIESTGSQHLTGYTRPQRTVYQILHSRDLFHRKIGVKMWNKLTGLDFVLYPQEKATLTQSGTLRRLRRGESEVAGVDATVNTAAGREDPLWETTKCCMYHHFGAIHLLRFLVIVLLKLNKVTENPLEDSDGSGSNKRRRMSVEMGGDDNSDAKGSSTSKSGCTEEEVHNFARSILDLLETPEYFPYLRT